MAWAKSSPRLVAAFASVMPSPPAERKTMFGYPSAFVNGNLFMGLWQEEMMLRLPEGQRAEVIRMGGKPFAPMPERPMKEYVSLPPDMIYDTARLVPWVRRSLDYTLHLPAKVKGKAGGRAKSAKPSESSKTASKRAPAAKTARKAAPKKSKGGRAQSKPKPGKQSKISSRSRARPRTGR